MNEMNFAQNSQMADDLLVEEREEELLIVSPNHKPIKRKALFLIPSATTPKPISSSPALDHHHSSPLSANRIAKYNDLPVKIDFRGWKYPQDSWKNWVHKMHDLHRSTWKKAGILDAVMNSTHTIHRNNDLFFTFVENWSAETNTFAFPWGEATVTLEDVMVLGGFSVLGESCFTAPPEDSEMNNIVSELKKARKDITRTKARKADVSTWLNKFMDSGSKIEHEAFLTAWLSRFVFPASYRNTVGVSLIPVAVHLSRGVRIALAPAVLAGLYKSMGILKKELIAARKNKRISSTPVKVFVSAPLPLVQVWIWERFSNLSPKPNDLVKHDEPRFARWNNLKNVNILGCGIEHFQWRPYKECKFDSDDEFDMWVRCLRTSEVVGMEADFGVEMYLPHRVAMQFGFDQDIPGKTERIINLDKDSAWRHYNRPVKDSVRMYVPSLLLVEPPGVTIRYLKWWKNEFRSIGGSVIDHRDFVDVDDKSIEGSKLQEKKKKVKKRASGNSKQVEDGKNKNNFEKGALSSGTDDSRVEAEEDTGIKNAMADLNLVIQERKEEFIVSPNSTLPLKRKAHFLIPSATQNTVSSSPVLDNHQSSTLTSARIAAEYNDLPVIIKFRGWRYKYRQENWKNWVHRMHDSHHLTWKKAGIFNAIMNSTCTIQRNNDLIFSFVDKWRVDTNTFAFPWGEATITLEDVMVLGGFSVLGESCFSTSPEDAEMEDLVSELKKTRSDIMTTRTKDRACASSWMDKFIGSGSKIEHEAFLAYWLSRFVFPTTRDTIRESVLSLSVQLGRGIKIALAPAVLAGLYKGMRSFKTALTAARKNKKRTAQTRIVLTAPLQLVQVWIWERFPNLSPNPKPVGNDEPRFARWNNLKKNNVVGCGIEQFQWRPYTDYWALDKSDDEFDEWVRCLRTSEVVGMGSDCVEQYLPYRVAMQFGMDQDIPGEVARVNMDRDSCWRHYNKPVKSLRQIYVPSHNVEPGVTTRYLKWWENEFRSIGGSVTDRGNVEGDGSSEVSKGKKKVKRASGISKQVQDGKNANSFVPMEVSRRQKRALSSGVDDSRVKVEEDTVMATPVEEVSKRFRFDEVESMKEYAEIEKRMNNIEKLYAWIKAGKLGSRSMKNQKNVS